MSLCNNRLCGRARGLRMGIEHGQLRWTPVLWAWQGGGGRGRGLLRKKKAKITSPLLISTNLWLNTSPSDFANMALPLNKALPITQRAASSFAGSSGNRSYKGVFVWGPGQRAGCPRQGCSPWTHHEGAVPQPRAWRVPASVPSLSHGQKHPWVDRRLTDCEVSQMNSDMKNGL